MSVKTWEHILRGVVRTWFERNADSVARPAICSKQRLTDRVLIAARCGCGTATSALRVVLTKFARAPSDRCTRKCAWSACLSPPPRPKIPKKCSKSSTLNTAFGLEVSPFSMGQTPALDTLRSRNRSHHRRRRRCHHQYHHHRQHLHGRSCHSVIESSSLSLRPLIWPGP